MFAFESAYSSYGRAREPTDAELATQALADEQALRFPSWKADDAVTLGLSLRKRFRTTSRAGRGVSAVLSVQTIHGHTLFSCTVGDDASPAGWSALEASVGVVRQTGHSSFYIEKGMAAVGKSSKQLGIQSEYRVQGGAFPIWLENASCCPIAIVALYSGSGAEDHRIVLTALRDYLKKMTTKPEDAPTIPSLAERFASSVPERDASSWLGGTAASAM